MVLVGEVLEEQHWWRKCVIEEWALRDRETGRHRETEKEKDRE